MLKIKNLTKNFDQKEVLKDVSLTIKEGDIFGLVGINGAGKSTLLRTICGVFEKSSGQIELFGEPIEDHKLKKNDIFFLSDNLYVPRYYNYKNLLKFYSTFYEINEKRFEAIIRDLKLDIRGNISTFSKGMKRQLFIALVLSMKLKLLMLDEAFDGLDPLARLVFKKYLLIANKENNLITIVTSHDLKELQNICTTFAILDGGTIVLNEDLSKETSDVVKYQLAFKEDKTIDDFKDFNVIDFSKEGKVIKIVIKGNSDEVMKKLDSLNPILLEKLDLNFEEFFMYEAKERGYIK